MGKEKEKTEVPGGRGVMMTGEGDYEKWTENLFSSRSVCRRRLDFISLSTTGDKNQLLTHFSLLKHDKLI